MNTTEISFDKTYDAFEQHYLKEIEQYFPKYAEFWEKFIKVRIENLKELRPAGLELPNTFSDKEHVTRTYEALCIAHYSLLRKTMGAYSQLKQWHAYKTKPSGANKTELVQTIEMFYIYLGHTRNMFTRFWNIIANLTKTPGLSMPNFPTDLKQKVGTLRNFFVHYGQYLFWITDKGLSIPDPTTIRNLMNNDKEGKGTCVLWEDLKRLPKVQHNYSEGLAIFKEVTGFINKSHAQAIQILNDYFSQNAIRIKPAFILENNNAKCSFTSGELKIRDIKLGSDIRLSDCLEP